MQISLTTSSPRLFNRKFWWRITFLFFTHYHPPKPKQKFIFNRYKLKTNLQTETFLENHVSNQISFGHGQGREPLPSIGLIRLALSLLLAAHCTPPNINLILVSLLSNCTVLMLVLFAGRSCPWWNYLNTLLSVTFILLLPPCQKNAGLLRLCQCFAPRNLALRPDSVLVNTQSTTDFPCEVANTNASIHIWMALHP